MNCVTRPLVRSELFSEMATQMGAIPGVIERDSCQGNLNEPRVAVLQGGTEV